MSARIGVRLALTLHEARVLLDWLDLASIVERRDWKSERARTVHALEHIEERLREQARRATSQLRESGSMVKARAPAQEKRDGQEEEE